MERVLIISSSDKGRDFFVELMKSSAYSQIVTVKSGGEARRVLMNNEFDIIVINAPLTDEFGVELAVSLTRSTLSGLLLVVKSDLAEAVSLKVEDYGVFVLEKPVMKQFFYQALKMVSASRRRLSGLKMENVKLQQKIMEIRLVDRAKCTLIQYLNMTEQQAHRYIEKQAMDLRKTKREVAEEILKTYES